MWFMDRQVQNLMAHMLNKKVKYEPGFTVQLLKNDSVILGTRSRTGSTVEMHTACPNKADIRVFQLNPRPVNF